MATNARSDDLLIHQPALWKMHAADRDYLQPIAEGQNHKCCYYQVSPMDQ